MPIVNNRKSDKLYLLIPAGLILIVWTILIIAGSSGNYTRKSYSEFIQQVEVGDVAKATIDDQEIRYELKVASGVQTQDFPAKNIFITRRLPEDPGLAQILRTNRVEHSASLLNPLSGLWTALNWIGISSLLLLLWFKLTSGSRASGLGMLGIGDSHAKTYQVGNNSVNFSDFAGIDEAKAEFQEAARVRGLFELEKKSWVLNDLEKATVAYHEVGHAIVGYLMPGSGAIEKISIVPRGMAALGYTLQLPQENRFLMMEDELRGQIAILLGGRSAEELIMGKVSTGASDDIQKATDLSDQYVSIYGMSKQLGPMAFDRSAQRSLGGWNSSRRPVSPQVEAIIDRGIKNLIDHAHHAAQAILAHNEPLLRQMAEILQEQEILEGQELHAYLRQVQTPALLDKWLQTGELEVNYPINDQLPVIGNSHNQSSYEYSHS